MLLLRRLQPGLFQLAVSGLLLLLCLEAGAQSLGKLERRAINRTHLTFVNGDTVQRFTITDAHPTPRAGRFYYWQGPTQILRTAGAYNGKLLTGPYQLTSRNGNLLGGGTFKKGLKAGRWRTWRADGTPLSSSYWQQGRRRGRVSYYDETGQLLRPATPPRPAKAVTGTTQQVRFWQIAYYQQLAKRLKTKLPHHTKVKGQLPATGPAVPGSVIPTPALPPSPGP